MKQNITLSIDKELIKNARVLAAQRQISVSRMLSEELQKLIENSNKYELAKKQMKLGGNVVAFEIKGGIDAGRKFINAIIVRNQFVCINVRQKQFPKIRITELLLLTKTNVLDANFA